MDGLGLFSNWVHWQAIRYQVCSSGRFSSQWALLGWAFSCLHYSSATSRISCSLLFAGKLLGPFSSCKSTCLFINRWCSLALFVTQCKACHVTPVSAPNSLIFVLKTFFFCTVAMPSKADWCMCRGQETQMRRYDVEKWMRRRNLPLAMRKCVFSLLSHSCLRSTKALAVFVFFFFGSFLLRNDWQLLPFSIPITSA